MIWLYGSHHDEGLKWPRRNHGRSTNTNRQARRLGDFLAAAAKIDDT